MVQARDGWTMMLTIVDMPEWKSKILNAVAAILGYRGEYVYVVTLDVDLKNMSEEKAKEILND